MNAPPRVSVVIPAHNCERFIAATVRSALAAATVETEVLVIDDGSSDQTANEVRRIDDPRVSLTSIPASGGPSRPRNIGIQSARAPYVSLLDADDLLKPGKLAAATAALDRCPSAGCAFGDYERMDEDGNVFETSSAYAYPALRRIKSQPADDGWRLIRQSDLARALVYENFIGTSGVVLRKDLAVAVGGFDETITFGEDVDFWFRLAHRCDALYLPSIGHSYRVHSTGLTQGNPPMRNSMSCITVLRREAARWHDPAARRQLRRRIAMHLDVIAYQQSLRRERWSATRSCLRAYASFPARHRLVNVVKAALLAPGSAVPTRD
jgi:glycosyltransferase involved in cell wall biosynthesis